jgi:hypothetical protein
VVVLDVVVVLDEVVVVLEDVVVGGKVVVVVVVDVLVVDELVVDDLTTTVLAEMVVGVTELELELELELDVLGAELDELSLGASVELTPALATELVDPESPLAAAATDDVVVVAFGSNWLSFGNSLTMFSAETAGSDLTSFSESVTFVLTVSSPLAATVFSVTIVAVNVVTTAEPSLTTICA